MREKILKTYPYPIAYRYGSAVRVLHDEAKLLDQIVFCAEAVAQYLAALAIASFAAREADTEIPKALQAFEGNLAWGHYDAVVKAINKVKVDHPLRDRFRQCLRPQSVAVQSLDALLQIRNKVRHNGDGLTKASQILEEDDPAEKLRATLRALEPICLLPLFYVENLAPKKKIPYARLYTLMGEQGKPIPEEYAVTEATYDNQVYLGLPEGILCLHPMLIWNPNPSSHGLHIIHRITTNKLEYTGIDDLPQSGRSPQFNDMERLRAGERVPIEALRLADETSIVSPWLDQRATLISVPVPRDKKSFLEQLAYRCSRHVVSMVSRLLSWTRQVDIVWSREHDRPAFGLGDDFGPEEETFAGCWLIVSVKGEVELNLYELEGGWTIEETENFQHLREEFCNKLNEINGIALSLNEISGASCSIQLASLETETALVQLAEVCLWYKEKCGELPRMDYEDVI